MIFAIRKAIRENDFYAVHSQGLRIGFQTAIANWRRACPHVMTLHDVIVPQNDVPGKLKRLKKNMIGFVTRHVDEIIPVTDDCKENHLSQFPIWKKGPCRVETILNGIDLEKIHPEAGLIGEPIRKQRNLSQNVTLVGFFGRFMPQKGFLPLLEGMKILASRGYEEKILLVVTRDEHGYREYIHAIESDETLQKMVVQVEQQNNISSLIEQMDCVIMPSLWEACGLVAMEAMVLGVPFIGSTCIGVREVIRDTPCRAVVADDAVSIADEIEKGFQNPWKDEAQAFIPVARERFDFKRCAERIKETYLRCQS